MRKILAFLAAFLPASAALASCPATLTDCPNVNANNGSFGGKLFWGVTGLHADGTTSDDQAVATAVANCNGGMVMLPPGKILFTGAATVVMSNCHLQGAGTPAGSSTTASLGTTILITSTSVKPFTVKQNWSISGINFYWPNQTTGTTSYPPLFSDDGSTPVSNFSLDHITVVNGYDVFAGSTNVGWGNGKLTVSSVYALNDAIRLNVMSDAWYVNSTIFDPGPWINVCSSTCFSAINAAALVNTIFHAVGPTGNMAGMTVTNSGAFDWRYGVKVDGGGAFSGTLNMNWDGVLTLVDSSSGGNFAPQNVFSGATNGCYTQQYGSPASGNSPCFNLGSVGGLTINGFKVNQAQGSVISTAGASIDVNGVEFDTIGLAADGSDYSSIVVTGGTPAISVRNSNLGGRVSDAHVHGINISTHNGPLMSIQNNRFSFFEEDILATTGGTAIITGNVGGGTTGSVSIVLSGTGGVTYSGNLWDKPPRATIGNCGTSPTITGTFSGFATIGTGGVTACDIGLPFVPAGTGGGPCLFQAGGGTPLIIFPNSVQSWHLASVGSVDISGQNIYYFCAGQW